MEEKIRLNPECIRCLINSRINSYPEDISKEEQITYMQRLLKVIADAPKSVSAPVVVRDVGKIEKEMFGKEKSYQDIKIYFNV